MGRKFCHLSKSDRLIIETMLNDGKRKKEIAGRIDVSLRTIYREIKRGQYEHLNSDYTTEMRYSADIAHEKYRENLRAKGPDLKIGKDWELAHFIENGILENGWSPEVVLGKIKQEHLPFKTSISKTTLYRYIENGLFLNISNKNLSVKGKRKNKYRKIHTQHRANAGDSIEKRPKDINSREEFGHWEMDSVMGRKNVSQNSLLTITERKTRKEIIIKLENHTSNQVCLALDALEQKCGSLFSKIFKTITVDNGSEFANCEGLEKTVFGEGKRTKIYYCHPYSSYERGSNEVANRMIRRKIPKGTNIDNKTDEEIQAVADWINQYPRPMFGYRTANMLFEEELAALT